jgi:hypothetical protein
VARQSSGVNRFTAKARRRYVVITGSRHWRDEKKIRERLARLPEDTIITHGAARKGADDIADGLCYELGFEVDPCPVNTKVDGPWPGAGHKRNARMLDKHRPGLVIAFRSGGKSNGTDNCIKEAKKRGIEVDVVFEEMMM